MEIRERGGPGTSRVMSQQSKVAEAHEAQQDFRYFLLEPPRPPRKLSGCCAGRHHRMDIPVPPLF
jgi:hypothetical protein